MRLSSSRKVGVESVERCKALLGHLAMRKAAKKSLPKGWTEGCVQELLGLSDEEAMIVEIRVRMAERVRECRIARRLTQKQLADRLHSKQPHIARLEQGDANLELMMRALLVMGPARAARPRGADQTGGRLSGACRPRSG